MDSRRTVALPFYLTACVIMFPALELVLTLQPWSPTVVSWRFGAVGLLVRAIMTPLVGLAMAFGTAAFSDHRRVLGLISVASWVGATTLLLLTGVFALDLVEFRELVRPESSVAFDTSAVVVLMKLGAGSGVFVAFALSAGRSARRLRRDPKVDPADLMAFKVRSGRTTAPGTEGQTLSGPPDHGSET